MELPLAKRMRDLRRTGRKAFVPFLTGGFPDIATSAALLRCTRDADFVEIGLPFSDPVADGPTICRTSEIALAQGMHAERLFELLDAVRERPPVIVMTYLNPVLAYGAEAFLRRASAAGVEGLILTDVPPEDGGMLFRSAHEHGVAMVLLVSPTTPASRMRYIASSATGFLYCVSVAGTTGARRVVGDGARDTVSRLRRISSLPVVVGFGISTPEHVRQTLRYADGVVVGSALLDVVLQNLDSAERVPLFAQRLEALRRAAHS